MCRTNFKTKCCFYTFFMLDLLFNITFIIYMSMLLWPSRSSEYHKGLSILVALCGLTAFLGFLGLWGTITESSIFKGMYAGLMLLILIGKVGLYFFYFQKLNVGHEARVTINESWDLKMNGNHDKMDSFQESLKCCGREGAWEYEQQKMPIPDSCNPKNGRYEIYQVGCRTVLAELLKLILFGYSVFFWICSAIDVITMVAAFSLCVADEPDE